MVETPVSSNKRAMIWRFSCVRMYYTALKKGMTPDPFCDFRAFMFLHNKPTPAEEAMIKRRLEKEIDELIRTTFTFQAAAIMKGSIVSDDKTMLDRIDAVKGHDGRLKIEINGYEAELIDLIEMKTFVENNTVRNRLFKRKLKKLPFNRVFRYVCFYSSNGEIKAEYDELDLFLMEREAAKNSREEY